MAPAMDGLLLATALWMAVLAAQSAVGNLKKRVLVLHRDGRREWCGSSSDDEGAACAAERLLPAPGPPGGALRGLLWPTLRRALPPPPPPGAAGCAEGGAAEGERAACGHVVRRALRTYLEMLRQGSVFADASWWAVDGDGRSQLVLDPDGVLCVIASLARRAGAKQASKIVLGDAEAADEAVRSAVGVGHKMAACLECLPLRKLCFGEAVSEAMGVERLSKEQEETRQMRCEVALAGAGFALSCASYNLAASHDAFLGEGLSPETDLLLRSAAKVLFVATALDTDVHTELMLQIHGRAVLEAAFAFAVARAVTPFVSETLPRADARGVSQSATNVALNFLRAGARSAEEAFRLMSPPSEAPLRRTSVGSFVHAEPFYRAACLLA